jgi:hypothetical protein
VTVKNAPAGVESVWVAQPKGGTSKAIYFDGGSAYLSQKIPNTQVRHISEVELTCEFTGRSSELWVELWSRPDGTGTLYGASTTTKLADGLNVYKFFSPVAVPASDFYLVLRDPYHWGRTQVVTNGTDLKFTIKTRE